MLAWARRIADGQWPYRDFWSNYTPGQPLLLAALVKLFGPSLLWWRIVRVAIDATVSVLAFAYVRREAGTGWAAGRVGGGGRGHGVAERPRPQPAGAGCSRSAPCWPRGGRRWAPARSPGLAIVVRPEIGIARRARARRSRRGGPARRASRSRQRPSRRSRSRPSRSSPAVRWPTRCSASPRCRTSSGCPSRWHYDGRLRPQQAARVLPARDPRGGQRAVGGVGARTPRRHRAGAAVAVGLAYLLARTDEFHLVPLSVVLAVALACAAGREARALPRAALAVALALVAVHGLERRAGQALHPPALAADPGGGGRRRAHRAGRRRRAARA